MADNNYNNMATTTEETDYAASEDLDFRISPNSSSRNLQKYSSDANSKT